MSSAIRAKTRVEFLAMLTLCTDSYLLTSPHLEDLFKVFLDRRSGLPPPLVASRALGRAGLEFDIDDRLGLSRGIMAGASTVACTTVAEPV